MWGPYRSGVQPNKVICLAYSYVHVCVCVCGRVFLRLGRCVCAYACGCLGKRVFELAVDWLSWGTPCASELPCTEYREFNENHNNNKNKQNNVTRAAKYATFAIHCVSDAGVQRVLLLERGKGAWWLCYIRFAIHSTHSCAAVAITIPTE